MEEQNLAEDNLLNFMNPYYVMKASGFFYLILSSPYSWSEQKESDELLLQGINEVRGLNGIKRRYKKK